MTTNVNTDEALFTHPTISFASRCWMFVLFPLGLLARTILFCLGWSHISENAFNRITKYDRSVVVFSHTSYSDFYIFALYFVAYPRRFHHVRILMKPQPFQYAGFILRRLGVVPATRVDEKNGGAVPRIVSDLKQWDKCLFLISPKGTIVKQDWRSGYYHIAKQLDAHILVAGLDYEHKYPCASEPITHGDEESDVKDLLLNELKKIVPLFPEDEIVPIRSHKHRSSININRFGCSVAAIAVASYFFSPINVILSTIVISNILF